MPEARPWRDGSTEVPPDAAAGGDDRLVAQAAELLQRFERVEDDELWAPATVTERWSQLERELQQHGRRKPHGGLRTLSIAGVAVAALSVVLVWSHQSARLPQRSEAAQSPAVARPVRPEQRPPEQSLKAEASASVAPESHAEPWATWPRTDLGPNGTLWTKPGSVMRLPAQPTGRVSDPRGGYVVQLDVGSLCAEVAPRELSVEGPFSVKTRQVEATVLGTHFCVEAGPELSSVSVQRGRVRVSHEEASLVLEAGESIRSDSPRLKGARASERPSERSGRERAAPSNPPGNPVAAPEDVAEPMGSLSLENRLYQQALQETRREHHPQAAGLLADYLKRYPTGLYAPEAGSELATELALAGRPAEAVEAARQRLRSFPRDPHDGDVKLLMAGLLRDDLGRPADALPIYEDLLDASAGLKWRAEALFGKGICEERLGGSEVAREMWRRYQAEYPGGSHAAEVVQLLGE